MPGITNPGAMFLTFHQKSGAETTLHDDNITTTRTTTHTPAAAHARPTPRSHPYAPHLAYTFRSLEVQVEDEPEQGNDGELRTIWAIRNQPPRQLTRGHMISMRSSAGIVGTGRITIATNITRHWITLRLKDGGDHTQIRVPIPWANMGKLEQYAHTSAYMHLSRHPGPHRAFMHRHIFMDDSKNPYEFDLDPRELTHLAKHLEENRRLRRITERRSDPNAPYQQEE
ncbi:uncharacterized protein B0H18DRAFT_954691 [Fomitopsis serialis]|uniref:uncharacterized protein n=1 Tax=Fomitopsis serialis TaxID=139415 RepID=UPI00200777AB|nr:uncharacterized protein B0H18DRAFT_954691 [Neoantrodia serialis]KAH9926367.1 hypothetical protein B0H18DRAFT_954691 [Neoantrodia serialis]